MTVFQQSELVTKDFENYSRTGNGAYLNDMRADYNEYKKNGGSCLLKDLTGNVIQR